MNLYEEHLERTMKAVHMEKVDKIAEVKAPGED